MATIIPALIGAAAAVAPTIFGIVDDQQRRKKEEKEKTKAAVEQVRVDHYQNAGIPVSQVPSLPAMSESSNQWPEWALPVAVTGGVILFGTLAILAFASTGKKKKKKKSSGKKAKVEDDNEDSEEEYDEEE